MTKNQFLTDANAFITTVNGNYADSTMDEKARKLRFYADIMYHLYEKGEITTLAANKMTAEDLHVYVSYRRSMGIKDSTLVKDLSIIGGLLAWKGNNARDVYAVQYGNKKPCSYSGRIPPLDNDTIERIYDLARSTNDWALLQGCVVVVLGCASGLRPQEIRQLYVDGITLMGDRSTIRVDHVKGEGKWGRVRTVPIMDGAEDIIEKYLVMRQAKLDASGTKSRSMFPTFRSDKEFVRQQSLGRFKSLVEDVLGVRFEIRDARRAFGQRLLDSGEALELVSYVMGHSTVETTQKFYANYKEPFVLGKIYDNRDRRRTNSC